MFPKRKDLKENQRKLPQRLKNPKENWKVTNEVRNMTLNSVDKPPFQNSIFTKLCLLG